MDNTILPFILSAVSILAFILSLISLGYTKHQNRRFITVELRIDSEIDEFIKLCAFNSGYRSVALMSCSFLVNNEQLDIKPGIHKIDSTYSYHFNAVNTIEFPYGLKEGHTICYSYTITQFANHLYYKKYSGVVNIIGYYEISGKNKKYKSKEISFDIDKYKKL